MIDTWGFCEDLNSIVLHHGDMDDDNNNNYDNNSRNIDENKCKFTKIAKTLSIFELGTWNFAW